MFGTCFQLWLLKKFYFLWDARIDLVQLLHFFFLQPPIPKLTEPKASYFFFFFSFFPSTPNIQTHRTQIALKNRSSPPSSSIHQTQHPTKNNHHCANHKTSNQSTITNPAIHTTNTFNTTTNYTLKLRKN